MRRVLSFSIVFGLCGASFAQPAPPPSSAPTGSHDALILRVASLNAFRHDMGTLSSRMGQQGAGGDISKLLPILPRGFSQNAEDLPIDSERPWFSKLSVADMMGGAAAGFTTAIPLTSFEPLWERLESMRIKEAETEDGIRAFRSNDSTFFVRRDALYAVLGAKHEAVATFDLASLRSSSSMPPGSIALEVDIEAIAPTLMALLAVGTQQLQSRTAQEGAPGSAAVADSTRLVVDRLRVLLDNTSRLQLALEVRGEHSLFHARVQPRAASDLETLLENQPGQFPALARFISDRTSYLKLVSNFRMTAAVQAGMAEWMEGYARILPMLMASRPEATAPGIDEMFRAQIESSRKMMACQRGDMAVVWDIDPEHGLSSTTLAGMQDKPECRDLLRESARSLAKLTGPDGKPLANVADSTVLLGGVEAQRTDLNFSAVIAAGGAEGGREQKAMKGLLGDGTLTMFTGTVDGMMISTMGKAADVAFAGTVQRVRGGSAADGLTAETFAPLDAGGGLYFTMDLARLRPLAKPDAAPGDANAGPLVFGAHAEQGRLYVDVAVPLALFSALPKMGGAAGAADAEKPEEAETAP